MRLAAKQHGVISAAEATNFEVTRAQLRSGIRRGDWLTPHAGVLIAAAAPATWMQRCMVATQRSGGLISHRAAARLHGLDGFHGTENGTRSRGSGSRIVGRGIGGAGRGGDDEAGLVELTVPDSKSRATGDFLVHRTCVLAPEDCTVTAGIAVTSIARTLVDLGAVVSDDRVEQALDDAIRRGTAFAGLPRRSIESIDQGLADAQASGACWRGLTAKARSLIRCLSAPWNAWQWPAACLNQSGSSGSTRGWDRLMAVWAFW